jgi:hypothetical protein
MLSALMATPRARPRRMGERNFVCMGCIITEHGISRKCANGLTEHPSPYPVSVLGEREIWVSAARSTAVHRTDNTIPALACRGVRAGGGGYRPANQAVPAAPNLRSKNINKKATASVIAI